MGTEESPTKNSNRIEIENKKYLFKLIIKKTNKIKQNFEAFIKKKKNYFREGIEKKKRKWIKYFFNYNFGEEYRDNYN